MLGRSCVFTLPSSGGAQELITRVWRRSQTVCCDVLSHVIKLCSSERLDNTSSFFHLAVCGQMPLNIKWEREQSALVNSEPVEGLSVINRDNQLPAKSSTCYANTLSHTYTPPARYLLDSHSKFWEICIQTSQQRASWWTERLMHHGKVQLFLFSCMLDI